LERDGRLGMQSRVWMLALRGVFDDADGAVPRRDGDAIARGVEVDAVDPLRHALDRPDELSTSTSNTSAAHIAALAFENARFVGAGTPRANAAACFVF
jgi:hypothetical protein